jgi:uncharacterized protein (TIGR03437 family)
MAPGSLISIYGTGIGPSQPGFATLDATGKLSTQVGGVRLLFNGVPSPLLYVSATQINALAPFSVAPGTQVLMEVEYNGVKSDAWRTWAYPVVLSVFPSAINEDGTLNSQKNPGQPGSVVTIWVSGLGYTNPQAVDGLPAPLPLAQPLFPVSVEAPFELLYAGNAFGVVEGVMQINFRLPSQPGGFSVVTLTVGDDSTNFVLYY